MSRNAGLHGGAVSATAGLGIPAGEYAGSVHCCDRLRFFVDEQLVCEKTRNNRTFVQCRFGTSGVRLDSRGKAVSPGDECNWQSDDGEASATVQRLLVSAGHYVEIAAQDSILLGDKPLILSGITRTTYVWARDGSVQYAIESFMTTPRGAGRSAVLHQHGTGILGHTRRVGSRGSALASDS